MQVQPISSSVVIGLVDQMLELQLRGTISFFNAGCYNDGGKGWGVVFTSVDKCITYCACRREEVDLNPLMAEALEVRWALSLVSQMLQLQLWSAVSTSKQL